MVKREDRKPHPPQDKAARDVDQASVQEPGKADVENLITLFRGGHFEESLAGARKFIRSWPHLGFGWTMSAASCHALGRLEEAAEDYRRALRVEPGNAEAHNNLGNILRDLGRHAESAESHGRAVVIKPGFLEAYFNLGLSFSAMGSYAKAESAFRKVLEIRPDIADAHNYLGNLYKAQGRLDEAISSYRRALQMSPDFAELYSNLASALAARGSFEEAEKSYRRALEIKPRAPDILSNLGTFLMTQQRVEEAEKCYRSALETNPDSADLHNNLGIALRAQGRLVEAGEAFRRARELKPASPSILHNLGDTLMDEGRLDEAEAFHREAVELQPDSAAAHRNLGVTLAVLGRSDEALQSYRQAIEIDPDQTELYYRLSEVKRFETGDPELAKIEELLTRRGLGANDLAWLHYAAGKANADIGEDFDRSFEHYAAGARARRSQFQYDVESDEAGFSRLAGTFPESLIDRIVRSGYAGDGPAPVLVVGMPRSGTTLVENILASHPGVHGAGERFDLDRLVDSSSRFRRAPYPEWVEAMTADEWKQMGQRYSTRLAETAPDVARVVDKMPNNFRHLGLVAGMLADVRVIHVYREPLDTCVSCFTHLFEGDQLYSYDLRELGRFYTAYAHLMSHWRRVLPQEILLEIRYEDIVADPENSMKALLSHCGLEWDPAVLDFHTNRRAISTASLVQVRQPIYADSIGRWRVYGGHLGPLTAELEGSASNDQRDDTFEVS